MKNYIKDIEALPSKRIYLSIIADYHLKTALCELIDNAIDSWIHNGKKAKLNVQIDLDYTRQVIKVTDNCGGIPEEDIGLIVSPGHSKNSAEDMTIGIFGVGSKRAVVALSEEIKIYTRFKNKQGILVEINDTWIKDDSTWDLPIYNTTGVPENTTIIELVKLRTPIVKEHEAELINHLGATYSYFLNSKDFELNLNTTKIDPVGFEKWSYPPTYEPKQFNSSIDFGSSGKVEVEIIGGLTKSKEPSGGEYGTYFYCNNRLISRAYKGPEVGYRQAKIGQPHPSISLARAIVKLNGPTQLMPWNSSKSEINTKHPTFKQLEDQITRVLMHYATLSKRWSISGGWDDNVFQYKSGNVSSEVVENISAEKLYLPPIPRASGRKYAAVIKANNSKIAEEKPWTVGLYETIIAVDEIFQLKLEQKNRIAMLTLDSMLEIAFKEYLVNDSGTAYSASRLEGIMKDRSQVHTEVKRTLTLTHSQWQKIEYYYKLRCELVHKRATVTITDTDLNNFRKIVELVLKKMFGLNFKYNS